VYGPGTDEDRLHIKVGTCYEYDTGKETKEQALKKACDKAEGKAKAIKLMILSFSVHKETI
jgi:hypothetical protein